jgi:hypothetical protein
MNCQHWRECNIPHGGCCDLGFYGGTPSLGTCKRCLASDKQNQQIPQQPTILGKALSYFKAEVSAVVSSITEEQYQARLDECSKCPLLVKSTKEDELGWCKGCGCGQNSRAELKTKAKMPAATCPLKKWG